MGKGDKKTARGKRFSKSFGKTRRPRKRNTAAKIKVAKAAKAKAKK